MVAGNHRALDVATISILHHLDVLTKKENRSKAKPTDKELVVNILDLKKLLRGFRYFYLVNVYAEKPGNLSEETFKDWSISDPDAEAFKDQNPVELLTCFETFEHFVDPAIELENLLNISQNILLSTE